MTPIRLSPSSLREAAGTNTSFASRWGARRPFSPVLSAAVLGHPSISRASSHLLRQRNADREARNPPQTGSRPGWRATRTAGGRAGRRRRGTRFAWPAGLRDWLFVGGEKQRPRGIYRRIAGLADGLGGGMVCASQMAFGAGGSRTLITSGPAISRSHSGSEGDQAAVEAFALTPLRSATVFSLVLAAFSSLRLVVKKRTISSWPSSSAHAISVP